ncbi:MAG TPA: GGDEF domain-containing protein [Moraxellaceae bacterium]|nr:GGDEF domain-containing protein [Moraxellaceae bacterium]
MSRLRQRLAAVLEWSEVDKSLYIMVALIPILGLYLNGISYALEHPQRDRLVHVAAVQQMQLVETVLVAGALVIASYCLYLRSRRPDTLWVQHLAAQYYSLAMVASSYYIGTMTLCTGVIMLGAPVFGFILLNRRVVWWATATGIFSLLVLNYAAVSGSLPYAPVVVPPTDVVTQRWWTDMIYLFTAPHVIVILLFADQTVHWWHQREDTIRHLSVTDMLTGVHNRRSIMELLDKEVARSARTGQPLSLVILDLDHFKFINDTWGHPTGDRVLQQAARTLTACLRQTDAVGRHGGEEFMMLLPSTTMAGACALVERCRSLLASTEIRADSGESFHTSASFGVSCTVCPEGKGSPDAETLIRAADQALYRAKLSGRNRVEAAAA